MDRVKFLLLGLILLGCIIVPLATKAAVRDLTDRQVAMLLPPLWLAPALPGAPRSHLGDIEAPYRADGIATADIDLDTGGFSLILDDGATGAGNGAIYFGQDTDLGFYRSAANVATWEGGWTATGVITSGNNMVAGGGAAIFFTGRSVLRAPADGQLRFTSQDATAFAKLQLGPDEQAADTAPAGSTIKSTNAYSLAETNTTGGPLYLGGGVGTKEIKIVQASASGSTLTFVVDGTSTTITADTEWNCTTDDATCCAELETYLDANIAGFTATCDTVDEVYLIPDSTTRDLSLASADAAGTKFVVVDGAEGSVLLPSGSPTHPSIAFARDNDGTGTGIYSNAANTIRFVANGAYKLELSGNTANFSGVTTFNLNGAYVTDTSRALALGAAADAAGSTGEVTVGGSQLLVDNKFATGNEGVTIANGATTFAVTSSFATVTGDGGGDEVIATITGGIEGMQLTLLCVDALWTLTDTDAHTANTVDLDAPFVGADDEILVLIHDGTSWYEQGRSKNSETSLTLHGEMFVTAGGGLTIATQSIPYTVDTLATGDVNGWTFTANATGPISQYADGTGKVVVYDVAHGLVTGDVINIQDTTDYNGIWAITYVDPDRFTILDTWVNDNGASNWFQGDRLVANTGSAGKYSVHFNATVVKGAGASQEFTVQGYINENASTHMIVDRELISTDAGSISFGGVITIADADEVFITITNNEGTNDITLEHATFWLTEI